MTMVAQRYNISIIIKNIRLIVATPNVKERQIFLNHNGITCN